MSGLPGTNAVAPRATPVRRSIYVAWILLILVFAALHLVHLRADFPNYSPWVENGAKYTDEGWYGNAAAHARLLGQWYVPGDFNPAPAEPVLPFLEWIGYGIFGFGIETARAIEVMLFFSSLALAYVLLRDEERLWPALTGLMLLVTSPYLYCFSRLALVEMLVIPIMLAAILVALRLPRMRNPTWGSVGLGVLCALLMLAKPTAILIFPAIICACLQPLWAQRKLAIRSALITFSTFVITFGAWIVFLALGGLFPLYKYLFEANRTPRAETLWALVAALKLCYFGIKVDGILVPLGVGLGLSALLACRQDWARRLWQNPVFTSLGLAVAGYAAFMIYHGGPRQHYFSVVLFPLIIFLTLGAKSLVLQAGRLRLAGQIMLSLIVIAMAINGFRTLGYALHPQYTFANAADELTRYVDTHPNGNRVLASNSGDDINLFTRLPALCDEYGTEEFGAKLRTYQPGWFAVWNQIPEPELAAIHRNFTIEQVSSYHAFDEEDRNLLVLFKLHPLDSAQRKAAAALPPDRPYPDDRISVPVLPLGNRNKERMRHKLVRVILQHLPRVSG